ncbi:hypothetical protein QR46_0777 [Giardia duodenalis assemblage B]|uniref:Uncharacterized protein n=3 Tax=Giardia intestinalis TaxID=5741 RepID=A0A132NYU9_GIAIN|nr:Hypothetical protein GL50581_3960 [Giardia intestinalis ATCC 50581]KWX15238.1 hypothetical protein QR46_0777 [Giardia intestinalis assemblage B]
MRHLLLLRPADPYDFLYKYYKTLAQESIPIKLILDAVSELPLDAVDVFCLYMSRLYSILKDNPVYIEGICNASSHYVLTNKLVDEGGRLLLSQTSMHKLLPLCMVQNVQIVDFSLFLAKTRAAFVINRVVRLLYSTLQDLSINGRVPETATKVLTHYIPMAQSFSLSFLPPSSLEIDTELHMDAGSGEKGGQTVESVMEALVKLILRTDSLLVHCDTDDRYEKTDLQLIHVASDFWGMI